MSGPISLDTLLPPTIAKHAEDVGVCACRLALWPLLTQAVRAGVFLAFGAIFSTAVNAYAAGSRAFGVTRLLAGVAFCPGMILIVMGGAELFAGNVSISMAWTRGKVSTTQLLRHLGIVYAGNFVGALATAVLTYSVAQYTFSGGAFGLTALELAHAKSTLGVVQAISLGILGNALVCLAMWLYLGARTTTDTILAMLFPISALVAAGFEHSVANMYFIPIGLLIKADTTFLTVIGKSAADYADLTWTNFFLVNLLPVTVGNVVGGVVLVALVYWVVYVRQDAQHSATVADSS
jgi:formate transporter